MKKGFDLMWMELSMIKQPRNAYLDTFKIHEGRALRHDVGRLINKWEPEMFPDDYNKYPNKINKHLAQLIDSYDGELQFWNDYGIEAHVYDALLKLAGPHGHTFYKVLLIRQGERDENRDDT